MARIAFENFDQNSRGYYNALTLASEQGYLPPGGKPGQILLKTGYADYDAEWVGVYIETDDDGNTIGPGGGGEGGDVILDSIAPIRVSGGGSAWTISIDEASPTRPGSLSAADKRRLDNLPCWVGATAPLNARTSDFWWNTEDGTLYILYQDKDSIQWVPATPTGGGQGQGIYFGDLPPSDPTAWAGWYDTTIGTTFLWYADGNSAAWVPVSPQGGGQNGPNDEGTYGSN
jgi:hypothetical protein